jgi:hypothetical protein
MVCSQPLQLYGSTLGSLSVLEAVGAMRSLRQAQSEGFPVQLATSQPYRVVHVSQMIELIVSVKDKYPHDRG